MKVLQFELWPECNCQCEFCFLKDYNKHTPVKNKIAALDYALDAVSNKAIYLNYEVIALIGGEFFQGQLLDSVVKDKFFSLIRRLNELLSSKEIKRIWISASLMIGNQKDLFSTLDLLKENLSNVYINTSFDIKGRFKTDKMKKLWQETMKQLHFKYPSLNINTTIILTKQLVQDYLNDKFTFHQFSKEYNTELFLKHPDPYILYWDNKENNCILSDEIASLDYFLCDRKSFLKFLVKFKEQEPEAFYEKMFNIQFRADDLVQFREDDSKPITDKRYKNQKRERKYDTVLPCGHSLEYQCYCDSNKCILCDKLSLL